MNEVVMPSDNRIPNPATDTAPHWVSIIIPVYNGMPFIVQTIESVRRQSYPHWELVICDNASTDNTVACVLEELRLRPDGRIHLVTHDAHLAMVPNWNRALGYATHDLIKLLPSDDIILPDCLEVQVRLLQENIDVGFVTSGKELIDASGRKLFTMKPLKKGKYDWQLLGARSLYAINNLIGEPGGVLFRARLLKLCGDYDPRLKYYLDLELLLRFLQNSNALVWGQPLYQFRIHGSSVSSSSRQLSVDEYFLLLEIYEKDLCLSKRPLFKQYLRARVHVVALLRKLVFGIFNKLHILSFSRP